MSTEQRLDPESAASLWETMEDTVDRATLSALVFERRDAQPLVPAIVVALALKALVGVFCSGVFIGLGVQRLGKRVGEEARELLGKLRGGGAEDVDEDEIAKRAEGWVAEARRQSVSDSTIAKAEEAVAALLIEGGEDPENARACAQALARAVMASG